jgi:hypothetical protein
MTDDPRHKEFWQQAHALIKLANDLGLHLGIKVSPLVIKEKRKP